MRLRRSHSAFTLVETLVAAGIFGVVAATLLLLSSTSMRLIARNLTTNHSHETVRHSGQKLLTDLHNSASRFRLIQAADGTFEDLEPELTGDFDPASGQYLSSRANGVRFFKYAAGPCKLSRSANRTDTRLYFDFSSNTPAGYVPKAGDRLVLPLANGDFGIQSVAVTPGPGSPEGAIVIDESAGVGITLSSSPEAYPTAYFYRRVAFTVEHQELRYHPFFEGAAKARYTVVRRNVTSPSPFALLYPAKASATSDGLNLRVSLESSDVSFRSLHLIPATTTLEEVIPSRDQPPPVANSR